MRSPCTLRVHLRWNTDDTGARSTYTTLAKRVSRQSISALLIVTSFNIQTVTIIITEVDPDT